MSRTFIRFMCMFFAVLMLCMDLGVSYAADSIKERDEEYKAYKQQYNSRLRDTKDQAALDKEFAEQNPEFWVKMQKEIGNAVDSSSLEKLLGNFEALKKVLGFDVSPSGPGGQQYTISNDGMEKKGDDIYKDSGLPSSFEGAEYYDVAYPYNLSQWDVGGYVKTFVVNGVDMGTTDYVSAALSDEAAKSSKITGTVSHEWTTESAKGNDSYGYYAPVTNIPYEVEESTGCEIRTVNGVKFYTTAIQKFPYNSTTALEWWGEMNSNGNLPKMPGGNLRTYVFDAILTDGTVIHFLVGDANHPITSGEEPGKVWGDNFMDKESGNKTTYVFNEMKMPQYKNISGVTWPGNVLELWGNGNCAEGFKSKYNIGNGDDQNRIAYYRMYNLSAQNPEAVKPMSGAEDVSFKLGSVVLKKPDGSSEKKENPGGIMLAQTGVYAESKYVDVEMLIENPLRFSTQDDLTEDQLKGIIDWRENIGNDSEDVIVHWLRVIVMLMGIAMLVWTMLIYMAYWFDRVNNFIDIDVLPMVTFGRFRVSPDEGECTFNAKDMAKGEAMTVNHKAIVGVCGVGLFFSVLVVSGMMYTLLTNLVVTVLKFVS